MSKLHTPAATHTHTRIRKAAARVLKSLEARARVAVQPPLHALCTHRASPCGHRLERVSQSRACRNNALIAHVSTRSFTSQPLAPDAHTHTPGELRNGRRDHRRLPHAPGDHAREKVIGVVRGQRLYAAARGSSATGTSEMCHTDSAPRQSRARRGPARRLACREADEPQRSP